MQMHLDWPTLLILLTGIAVVVGILIALKAWALCTIRRSRSEPCGEIPEKIARSCDPCIYSQSYLLKLNQPVTWDNPDIWLTEVDGITLVSSSGLKPSHEYLIHARISNASINPAFGVDVTCVQSNFGFFGLARVPVETNSDGTPRIATITAIGGFASAITSFRWKTPSQSGHYCLIVECFHPSDIYTGNNIGQENTTVGNGKRGEPMRFEPEIRNLDRERPLRVRFQTDTYTVPIQEIKLPLRVSEDTRAGLFAGELRFFKGHRGGPARYAYMGLESLLKTNSAVPRAVPEGWEIKIGSGDIELAPGEARTVPVSVTVSPRADARHLDINVTAIPERGEPGGITIRLNVE